MAIAVSVACSGARADKIIVKSGEVFKGPISGESRTAMRIVVEGLTVSIPKSKIAKVLYSRRPVPSWNPGHEEEETAGNPAVPKRIVGSSAPGTGDDPAFGRNINGHLKKQGRKAVDAASGSLKALMWGERVDRIQNSMWRLDGTVYNVFTKPMHYVRVTVRVYDKYRNLITTASELCSPSTIEVGQHGNYAIGLPYDKRIAKYTTDCSWQ